MLSDLTQQVCDLHDKYVAEKSIDNFFRWQEALTALQKAEQKPCNIKDIIGCEECSSYIYCSIRDEEAI